MGTGNISGSGHCPAAVLFPAPGKAAAPRRAVLYYTAAVAGPVLAGAFFNLAAYGCFRVNIPLGHIDGINPDTDNILILYLTNLPGRFCDFLSLYELPNSLSVYAHKEMIPFLEVFAVPFNVLAALAFIGIWKNRRNGLAVLTFISICAFAGIMMHFPVFYRYRLPAVPLIAILAGAGVMALYRYRRQVTAFAEKIIKSIKTDW